MFIFTSYARPVISTNSDRAIVKMTSSMIVEEARLARREDDLRNAAAEMLVSYVLHHAGNERALACSIVRCSSTQNPERGVVHVRSGSTFLQRTENAIVAMKR